ncbi:hypothetical protein JKP88DRAFT_175916 [Tribonema minus]|uniref:Uncharacterized protein n=1 Tax=Tribonema minus TaxID=303371 RepID=A0A836CLX5_9STRA|nr:hypothetical protein JKP88DRAFT_175916 [Tribonema minus]
MSSYASPDAAAAALPALRRDWAPHGVLVVPTLGERGARGAFALEVHSDLPLDARELPEATSRALAAEWAEGSAGGAHLHAETWRRNPAFQLRLRDAGAARVRIALSRPEAEWRAACQADSVGCMMGFYVLHGTRPVRAPGAVLHEGKPWDESPFVPTHCVATPAGFVLESAGPDDAFTVSAVGPHH